MALANLERHWQYPLTKKLQSIPSDGKRSNGSASGTKEEKSKADDVEEKKEYKTKRTQVPAKRGFLCMKFITATLLKEETPDTTFNRTLTKGLVMTPVGIPSTPPKHLIHCC